MESDVDLTAPGEYTIKVSGYEQEAEFPVVVQDTTYPEVEVKVDNRLAKAESKTYTWEDLVTSFSDNDTELTYGLYNFEKIGEVSDFDYTAGETSKSVYTKTTWDASTELMNEIVTPEEEGWYRATAVVTDRSGNAITSDINFIIDGTAPTISVPNEKVSLSLTGSYDFTDGVTAEDNVFPAERLDVYIDTDEYDTLSNAFSSGKTGTYPLTYYATDPLGNEGTLTIDVTLTSNSKQSTTVTSGSQFVSSDGTTFSSGEDSNSSDTSSNTSSSNSSSWDAYSEARIAFDSLNNYRAQAGLSALTWNDTLYQAALIRAQELTSNMSHTRPDGSSCDTIFTEIGVVDDVSTIYRGENAARLPSYSGAAAMDAWYESDGHRANMLKAEYTQTAIAAVYANGMYYWITLFMG
jgi:uncharacterized protein YkwD